MSSELTLTRRAFVKVGGALFVGVSLPAVLSRGSTVEAAGTTLDPTQLTSWLEIHEDGRILARTGRTETGTSASAFYAQVIAEELDVPAASVTLVMGHTDETPDGGYSAGFLSGAGNLRKVAAYTRQALLGLAATRLDVPAATLTISNGVVSGAGKRVSYADLVRGQQLDLRIPVAGSQPRADPGRHHLERGPPGHQSRRHQSHRRPADQADCAVLGRGPVARASGHSRHRDGEAGLRRGHHRARHAARPHGAARDGRLDARIGGQGGSRDVSDSRRGDEWQSRGSRVAQ